MNYPNKKKAILKTTNYANLGMTLESDIESTNTYYLVNKIAVIHKKPTPVQVVNVSYPARNKAMITEAYYKTPSTTDFNGIYKGKYLDFDCKETNSKTSLPLANIHPHQIEHLKSITEHEGLAFLIIHFKQFNQYFLLFISDILPFWETRNHENGRKSIPYSYIREKGYQIQFGFNPRLDYLKILDKLI